MGKLGKIIIIGLALTTLLIYNYLPYNSPFVEKYYSDYLFQRIRILFDCTVGRLPFPTIYILLSFLTLVIGRYLWKFLQNRKLGRSVFSRVQKIVIDSLTVVGLLLIAFYWLWGFNYKRVSYHQKNNFTVQEISEKWLFQELENVEKKMTTLSALISNSSFDIDDIEKNCRKSLIQVLEECGYKTSSISRVRVRSLNPDGALMVWSTAGIYLPFVSEGHIDDGLHPIVKPFTLAHEMTHGYGVTDESACNFLGFLACINSEDNFIQYSGWMGYLRYLMSASRQTNAEKYRDFLENLNPKIKADINAIHAKHQKYPSLMPALRDIIYDNYLKNHGVKEGLISYSMMVQLAANWTNQRGSFDLDEVHNESDMR